MPGVQQCVMLGNRQRLSNHHWVGLSQFNYISAFACICLPWWFPVSKCDATPTIQYGCTHELIHLCMLLCWNHILYNLLCCVKAWKILVNYVDFQLDTAVDLWGDMKGRKCCFCYYITVRPKLMLRFMTMLAQMYPSPQSKVWQNKSLKMYLYWPLPAASLNNPVLFVHSGVCGSASSLFPEAVDIKREEGPCMVIRFLLNIRGQIQKMISSMEDTGHASRFLPADLAR